MERKRKFGEGWEGWLAGAVTLVVVLVEVVMSRKVTFCGTPDSCAYLALGESLSRGRGFSENFLFQYQWMPNQLPVHGIEYWRPGTSFFLLLAKLLGGVNLQNGLVVTIAAGIVLACAAWKLAMDASGSRRLACASYLLCLVLPPVFEGGVSTDSLLFYGAAAAWFLALLRVEFRSYWEDAVALLCVGLVNLIRNDAILLLLPTVVVLALRRRRQVGRGSSAGYLALLIVGLFVATLPMLWIDHAVLGRVPTSLGALYLTDLSELSAYGTTVTWGSMMHHGVGSLVKLRVSTLPQLLYRIVFVLVGFGAIFMPVLGLRRAEGERVRLPELAGGAAFLVGIVGVYGLVIPAVGGFSGLRSFAGLLPLTAVLMVSGVACVDVSGLYRERIFAGVLGFYLLAGLMANRRAIDEMNKKGDRDRAVAAYLKSEGMVPGAGMVVMTKDAAQFSETTGYAAVPVPTNGWAGISAAVADWKPTRVLIEEEDWVSEQSVLEGALGSGSEVRVEGWVVLAPKSIR